MFCSEALGVCRLTLVEQRVRKQPRRSLTSSTASPFRRILTSSGRIADSSSRGKRHADFLLDCFALGLLPDMGLVHFAPQNLPSQFQLMRDTQEVPKFDLLCMVPIPTSYEALRGRSKGRTRPIYTERLLNGISMLRHPICGSQLQVACSSGLSSSLQPVYFRPIFPLPLFASALTRSHPQSRCFEVACVPGASTHPC